MYIDFIKFLFSSRNSHSIHSPFVFDFYRKIFKVKKVELCFEKIESLRQIQLKNKLEIPIQDFGAGSRHSKNAKRTIGNITYHSSKKPKWAQLLFRIARAYNYLNIIELGTSVGFTTAYLASSNSKATVYSFEGCTSTLEVARENLQKLNLHNVDFIEGNIGETLPNLLQNIESIDFVFFDANHQYEPTLQYFEVCLTKINKKSCFVFDDIYWSNEMKLAWNTIKSRKEVKLSIDLFFIGIVFFDEAFTKQNFKLR
jgi:predicted O-methyltransferase YrrM